MDLLLILALEGASIEISCSFLYSKCFAKVLVEGPKAKAEGPSLSFIMK